jgi:uncharacterized protein (UPF0276 family)
MITSINAMPFGAAARVALPARGGLGLKPEHFRDIVETWPEVGFFEVHAENYMVEGGPFHHFLTRIRERYPLSIHGVGLSIGGETPLNEAHLERLAALLDRYQPESFSEHLAWSSHGDVFLNDLLPVPYHRATLDRVCEHIDRVQSRLNREMLLENPATYVEFDSSSMSETEFIGEVVRRTGCGLLLDVNNVHVSCTNHGRDSQGYIDALPLDRVGEIHLAGFAQDMDSAGDPLLIDSHGAPIAQAVWDLYRHTLGRLGPMATLIERDNDIPGFDVLFAEAQTAERIIDSVAGTRPRLESAGAVPADLAASRAADTRLEGFARALLASDPGVPPGLTFRRQAGPDRGFAIYRNNVAVSLIDALADTYPVVRELVGDEFFRAMAQNFTRLHPPTSPVMAAYGNGFADFVAGFPPAATLPYLADVARLEWLYVQAYHAADADPTSLERIDRLLADESTLPAARFALHPSLAVLQSPHAVVSLWAAHQGTGDLSAIDTSRQESAVVIRHAQEVQVVSVRPGAALFIAALGRGVALGPAAESAVAADPDFDLADALGFLIRSGAITAIGAATTEGVQHEPEHHCRPSSVQHAVAA